MVSLLPYPFGMSPLRTPVRPETPFSRPPQSHTFKPPTTHFQAPEAPTQASFSGGKTYLT